MGAVASSLLGLASLSVKLLFFKQGRLKAIVLQYSRSATSGVESPFYQQGLGGAREPLTSWLHSPGI